MIEHIGQYFEDAALEPREPYSLTREEKVWFGAWTACATAFGTRERTVATSWADHCLEQFRKRFS